MSNNYQIKIVLLLFLFFLIESSNTPLELNTIEQQTLHDNQYYFYTLEIPISSEEGKSLVISIKGIDEPGIKFEDISNPDIYVSKKHSYPKDEFTSDWSGSRYGGDIVTIDSSHVKEKDLFHIGVFCSSKCNYQLQANLTETIELKEGIVYNFKVPKESSLLLQIHTKNDFKELSMSFLSYQLTPFDVFVHKENPSSSNTFLLKPSWISGYSLNILKGTPEYISNGNYKILLQAKEINAEIRLHLSYPETEMNLKSTEPIFDSVDDKKSRCYKFTMRSFESQENVIINILLFSGSIILQVTGFKSITNITYNTIPFNQYTYEIASEEVIILSPSEIKEMKKDKVEDNLHFCTFGNGASSYFLYIHLDSHSELIQHYNYILPGPRISGYLPQGNVTTYKLLEFSYDSNITFSLHSIKGEPILYAYFSDKIPYQYITESILQKELTKNHILSSNETFFGYQLEVLSKDNNCHNAKRNTGNFNDQMNQISCSLYAIVYCQKHEPCIYRLNTILEAMPHLLIPKTSFYNILPKDGIDLFSITIEDPNITNVTFVLQTISGETTLTVDYNHPRSTIISFTRYSHFNLPITIVLNPTKIENENLSGTYDISVKGVAFSTYSIYYYTHSKMEDETQPDWSSVSKRIHSGDIIHESIKGVPYQIFSYSHNENNSKESKDIIISLTRRNIRCVFFAFLDLKTFRYKVMDNIQSFQGFDWKSDYADQLIISKTDPKYKSKGTYYIVVARSSRMLPKETPEDIETIETFALSVIDNGDDLNLFYDHHSVTLKGDYKGQGYTFWNVFMNPLSLSINVQYGKINLYIDFEHITQKRITDDKQSIYLIEENIESHYLTISTDAFLKSHCNSKLKECSISIYIEKQSEQNVNYLIIATGNENGIQLLASEEIILNTLTMKEKHYYIVKETDITKTKSILVSFTEGEGQVYVFQMPYSNLEIQKETFPSELNYTFKGENSYSGQLITIQPNAQTHCLYCQYLITVTGEHIDYRTGLISYTIQYSKEIQTVYPNTPVTGLMIEGEIKYYQFHFDPEAQTVYVSLYNMKGDIELFLNYGESKPEFTKYHWRSINLLYSFIEIDLSDPILIERGAKTLEGTYTILMRSYSSTTYTLFVTSHTKKIVPIDSNSPGCCKCNDKTDKCHFRFDRLFKKYEQLGNITIVFTTNFIYGSGTMFAKLYNNNHEMTENLPSEANADYSNKKNLNFMKIEIPKTKENLSLKSILMITVQCHEKSLFDINSSKLFKYGHNYLDISRKNIFYYNKKEDKSTEKNLLTFYNFEKKDLNFEMYSYTGRADVLVYQNTTKYNEQQLKNEHQYVHLAQFTIEPKTSYYNTIISNSNNANENIIFDVKPLSDFGFYVKLNYDQEWIKVNIGRIDSFVLSHNEFHGYFDFLEDYQDVVLNIRCENPKSYALVYTKINKIRKETITDNLDKNHKLDLPTRGDYDNTGKTNLIISSVSLKISSEKNEGKRTRVLFLVVIENTEYSKYNSNVISILITPKVNYYQRISAKPLGLYYSTEAIIKNDTTIFDLSKQRSSDDIIVIDISTCDGEIDYKLTKQLTYFAMTSNTLDIKTSEVKENGRIAITLINATEDNYFLSVWGTKAPECKSENDNDSQCKTDIEYLMHYFTSSKDNFNINIVNPVFTIQKNDDDAIVLFLQSIKSKDLSGKIRNPVDLDFQIFISTEIDDFNHMESLCFLSKLSPYENKSYEPNVNKIIINGLQRNIRYYINVKMKDLKTGEMIAFKPIQYTLHPKESIIVSSWILVVIIIGLLIASGLLYYFYNKYQYTKLLLQYEMTDQRNLSQVPKSTSELRNITQSNEKDKYLPITKENESTRINN